MLNLKNSLFCFLVSFVFCVDAQVNAELSTTFYTNEDTTSIFIYAKTEEGKGLFLFDNGCQKSILFLDEKTNMQNAKSVNLFDADGVSSKAYLVKKEINISTLNVKYKGNVLLIKNRPVFLKERNVKGIIGADIINKYDWKIDFRQLKIYRLKSAILCEKNYFEIKTFLNSAKIICTDIKIGNQKVPFQLDLGFNSTISTSINTVKHKNILMKKYSYEFSISQEYAVDTAFVGVENIRFKGGFKIQNIPVFYATNETINLLGVLFFKPFGKMIILNSINKILIPEINSNHYQFKSIKEKNGVIVAQIVPLNSKEPSLLGKNSNDFLNITAIIIPTTLYQR